MTNLSPFPQRDDVVDFERHAITLAEEPGLSYQTYMYSASFQGNDRPAITAYGETIEGAVASLYNALTTEYELDRERREEL